MAPIKHDMMYAPITAAAPDAHTNASLPHRVHTLSSTQATHCCVPLPSLQRIPDRLQHCMRAPAQHRLDVRLQAGAGRGTQGAC